MMHTYVWNYTAMVSALSLITNKDENVQWSYVGGAINIESDEGPVLVAVCHHGLNCKEHTGAL